MDDPLKKLIKARDDLLNKRPLFGALMTMKYVAQTDIGTAAVDGIHFFYNPEFILKCDNLQLQGLCFHEHDHVAMLHFSRKGNRNHQLWNMATDYVINLKWVDLLGEKSFIKGGLLDEKYRDMSSEEVYKIIEADPPPVGDDWDIGGVGAPVDGKGKALPAKEVERVEQRVTQAVDTAIHTQKAIGYGGVAGIAREYMSRISPPLSYEDRLLQLMRSQAQSDWSYRKPDRYRQGDIKAPVIAVDTSGSISSTEISTFINHTFEILDRYNFSEVEVVYCDSRVRHTEYLSPGDKPHPRGGGGTDFAPVMAHILEKDYPPAGLIYYTDGECLSFGDDPEVSVLWVVSQQIQFEPPFGDVAYTTE